MQRPESPRGLRASRRVFSCSPFSKALAREAAPSAPMSLLSRSSCCNEELEAIPSAKLITPSLPRVELPRQRIRKDGCWPIAADRDRSADLLSSWPLAYSSVRWVLLLRAFARFFASCK